VREAHSLIVYPEFIMKIGILLCGDVPESLIDEFGDYSSCLQQQFNLGIYEERTVWNVYQKNELPDDVALCDAYVIGGSPSSVNDESDWINSLSLFILRAFVAKKKLFGICFGHQVINHALGGKVQKVDRGWGLGTYEVELFKDLDELKAGNKLSLIAMHQDQVITPAKKFEVVAGCDFCPNYITRYKNQVLTVQGHPEFSFSFFVALLKASEGKFPQEKVEKASASNNYFQSGDYFNTLVYRFLFDH
jgi:GMP synthase-like glutamine amidotransferase